MKSARHGRSATLPSYQSGSKATMEYCFLGPAANLRARYAQALERAERPRRVARILVASIPEAEAWFRAVLPAAQLSFVRGFDQVRAWCPPFPRGNGQRRKPNEGAAGARDPRHGHSRAKRAADENGERLVAAAHGGG